MPRVGVLSAGLFVATVVWLSYGLLLPTIAEDLGVTVATLGEVPTLVMLTSVVLGIGLGPSAERWQYHVVLSIGLLALAVSCIAAALAHSYVTFLLVALVGAFGRASVEPLTLALVASAVRDEPARRRGMSTVLAGLSLAGVVGIPLLGVVESHFGWRMVYLAIGAAAAGIASLCAMTVRRDVGTGRRRPWQDAAQSALRIIGQRSALGLISASMLSNGADACILIYLGAFLAQQHGLATQDIGLVYALAGLGHLCGSILARYQSTRVPLRASILVARLIGGVLSCLALTLAVPSAAVAALVTMSMLASGLGGVLSPLALATDSPSGHAAPQSLHFAALSLGAAMGAGLAAAALAITGYAGIGLCAVLFATGSAAVIWLTRPLGYSVSLRAERR